jgi:DNA-binding transcriptional MerR regulator
MLVGPESFDLNDLCERVGVTPRTVRYYVQQGLLPSPGARGPGARYDQGHLDRLSLIKRLQRQHLPLAEIRRRLEELDDAGVQALLEREPEPAQASALDYVRRVLAGDVPPTAPEARAAAPRASVPPAAAPMLRQAPGSPPAVPVPPMTAPAAAAPPEVAAMAAPPLPAARTPRHSQWERIALAPDVELHVRRPLSREQNRLVERLVDAARRIFAEEP